MSDKPFKIVKTNEREIEVQKPVSKYSFKSHAVKQKTHDLEIHHPETGEPVFTMGPKSYGKGYKLGWHPYMTSQYPELERSHEFGSRHHTSGNYKSDHMEVGGKDEAAWKAKHLYDAAARNGFKDTLETRAVPKPGQDMDSGNIEFEHHYHDRETGERIGSKGREGPFKYNSHYMDKHGIDQGVLGTLKGNGYQMAMTLHGEKGKRYSAIGQKKMVGGYFNSSGHKVDNGPEVRTYKAGEGVSDEQMSSAHEEKVRKDRDKPGYNFNLVRHTPSIFTASMGHEQGYGHEHITSVAHGGTLTVHSHNPTTGDVYGDKF